MDDIHSPELKPPSPGPSDPSVPSVSSAEISEDEEDNLMYKFSSCQYHGQIDDFNPDTYFSEYSHWEVYNKNKEYTPKVFSVNGQEYEYRLITVNNTSYVVRADVLSEKELEKLKPYCRCMKCCMFSLNPAKYFTCSCCVGCLKSDRHAQSVIVKTRRYLNKENKEKDLYFIENNNYQKK